MLDPTSPIMVHIPHTHIQIQSQSAAPLLLDDDAQLGAALVLVHGSARRRRRSPGHGGTGEHEGPADGADDGEEEWVEEFE
jgi:hypothetical protein